MSEVASPAFTPTQQRILAVLADGMMHAPSELHGCIDDELADKVNTLRVHIAKLRLRLRPQGLDIICQYHYRRYFYRQVRLLAPSHVG